jgi:serine/threonine-protein kinase
MMALASSGAWTSISASDFSTCASNITGVTECWGDNTMVQMFDSPGPDRATPTPLAVGYPRVELGDYHACGLDTGQLWCWGHRNEQASDFAAPTMIPGQWTDYAGGEHVGCALDNTGQRWCWGHGEQGRFGNGRAWTSTPIRFTRP